MDQEPIRCVDCGIIISQYEYYHEGGIEGWGYRDTIERTNAWDSLRCGICCEKLLNSLGRRGEATI